MKKILVLSETNIHQVRWALSRAAWMHEHFMMHDDWTEGLKPALIRRVRGDKKSYAKAIEAFEDAWARTIKLWGDK